MIRYLEIENSTIQILNILPYQGESKRGVSNLSSINNLFYVVHKSPLISKEGLRAKRFPRSDFGVAKKIGLELTFNLTNLNKEQ